MSDEANTSGSPDNKISPNQPGMPANPVPTISVPVDRGGGTASFDNAASGSKATYEDAGAESVSQSFGEPKELDVDPDADTEAALKGEPDGAAGEGEATTDGDKKPEGDSEALPEFDHANDEVVAKYDEKYLMDAEDSSGDKVINLNAFNAEMNAIYAETGKPDISPDGRAYLKKVFGIPDAAIDTHLAGLLAKAEQADNAIYGAVGGKETYDAAHAWATSGGYTDAQKASYNKAMESANKGDSTALLEQAELLKSRFAASGGKVAGGSKAFGVRRGSSPARVAGDGAPSQRVAPKGPAADTAIYASSEQHRVAQNEAYASGDPAKIKAVSEKLRRSMASDTWQG